MTSNLGTLLYHPKLRIATPPTSSRKCPSMKARFIVRAPKCIQPCPSLKTACPLVMPLIWRMMSFIQGKKKKRIVWANTDLGSLIGDEQCGNFRIFLQLRFCMKLILVILKLPETSIWAAMKFEILGTFDISSVKFF